MTDLDRIKQALELDARKKAEKFSSECWSEATGSKVRVFPGSEDFVAGAKSRDEMILMLGEALRYISKCPRYPGYDDSQYEAEFALAKLKSELEVK